MTEWILSRSCLDADLIYMECINLGVKAFGVNTHLIFFWLLVLQIWELRADEATRARVFMKPETYLAWIPAQSALCWMEWKGTRFIMMSR